MFEYEPVTSEEIDSLKKLLPDPSKIILPDRVSERFVVATDIDQVLGDYAQMLGEAYSEQTGANLETLPEPDYHYSQWGLTIQEHAELHTLAVQNGGFLTMNPLPGAAEVLQILSDAEIHIELLTARMFSNNLHAKTVADTVTWLDAHTIPYRGLNFSVDKTRFNANLYIDDSPSNIKSLQSTGKPVVIFDYTWNRNLPGLRVTNWVDLGKTIINRYLLWLEERPYLIRS